jgi:hypothetical protein
MTAIFVDWAPAVEGVTALEHAAEEALAHAERANDDAMDALQAGDTDAEVRALRHSLGHLFRAAAYAEAAGCIGWAGAIRILADDVRASLVTDDLATPF